MRIALSIAISLLFLSTSIAQPSLGVKAGLNVATLAGDTEEADIGSSVGAVGGVFARLPVSNAFVLQSEILYSVKGFELRASDATVKASYIEVPLLFGLVLPTSSGLNLGFLVGPALSLKISESTSGTFEGDPIEVDSDLATSSDFGVALGAQVGAGSIGLDLRYTVGLSNTDAGVLEGTTLRTRTLSATAFLRFGGR